jgi:hypothetical protein
MVNERWVAEAGGVLVAEMENCNMDLTAEKKLVPWRYFRRGQDGRKIMHDGSFGEQEWLYHLLPWKYAKTIIEDKCFRLSPVRDWGKNDPYEEWWCDIVFHRSSKLSKAHAYGQSWTISHFDEPIWRMSGFGRKKDLLPIVRIRCRKGEILEAGARFIENSPGSLYFGKVRYRGQNVLEQLGKTARSRKEVTRTAAELLVHKRNAYRFEREVRLLWVSEKSEPDGVRIPIDPAKMISQVMISPYAKNAQVKEVKSFCKSHGIRAPKSLIRKPPAPVRQT